MKHQQQKLKRAETIKETKCLRNKKININKMKKQKRNSAQKSRHTNEKTKPKQK